MYKTGLRLMLTPYLAGALVLVVIPAVISFALAFTRYDALSSPVWVGTLNFQTIESFDFIFPVAVRNSLMFVALAVPLRLIGTLLLALLLNHERRGVGIYRAAVYLPTVIPDVAYALIWLWIFNPVYGPLNKLLAVFGIDGPAWLVETRTALPALVIMSLFQIGEGFVVLLAALHEIPRDLYQSAAVDGGTRWQMFRFVTLPLIRPWLLLLVLRDIVMSAQNTFTPAYIMTGGDPYYATMFLPLHIYEEAFDKFRFGIGSAMMLMLFGAVLVVLALVFLLLRGWGYSDEV